VNDANIDPELLKRMMMGDFSASFAEKKEIVKSSGTKRNVELDLHFEKLYPTKSDIPAGQKLQLQLEELRDFILEANKNSIRNAYVIVGKGEGVLRKAVIREFQIRRLSYAEIANPPYFGNALKVNF